MHQMLYAVNRYRISTSAEVQNPFHPENAATMPIQQHGEPYSECGPINLVIKNQAERVDPGMFGIRVFFMDISTLIFSPNWVSELSNPSLGLAFRAIFMQSGTKE